MNQMLYTVKRIDSNNAEWNELIACSKQYSPFLRDAYLKILGFSTVKYLVYRKKKVFAGICIPISDETGEACSFVPFAPYQGILYSTSEDSYTDYHNNLEATEILLDYIYEEGDMKKVGFCNSYKVEDIRSIQWHHYHEPCLGQYNLKIWYTTVVQLDDSIRCNISKRRKRDYEIAKNKNELVYCVSNDLEPFIKLYDLTFKRQNIELDKQTLNKVKKITEYSLGCGIGELWYAKDKMGNYIDSTLFLYEKNVGYYLYGANDPSKRNMGGATFLFLEQFSRMGKKGITEFDFIGINSPQRGDFKLSFGGKIKPYYGCSVEYV